MATLEQLLQIEGVVAAGEFTPDGKLVDFKGKMEMSQEVAAMTAQFCATVTMLFNTLAGAHTRISGMNWLPQQGWAYSGGDWTVAIGGNRGVFVETAKADFNRLFQALVGERR
jgi:roadblock/LC7 domain-containing protein